MAMDYIIWKCTVLCLVFTGSCSMTSDFCKRITDHTDRKSWLDARRDCENSNQILLKTSHINELNSCSKNYNDYWIDKYNYLSNWMEIYGCYTFVNNSLDDLPSTHSYLTPGICDRKCQHTQFFGIMQEDCYCINTTFKEGFLSGETSMSCSTPCLDSHLYCGGDHAINLYRRVNSTEVRDQSDDKKCATLNCETRTLGLHAQECNSNIQILCNDKNLSNEFKNWTYQLTYCRNKNDPYISVGDTVFFCNKTGNSWSGVFRSVIDESSEWFPSEHSNINCFKLKRVGNGYTDGSSECTDTRKYICLQDPSSTHSTIDIIRSSLQKETTKDFSTSATTYSRNSDVSEISDPSSTHTTTTAEAITDIIDTSFKSETTLRTSSSATTSINNSNVGSQMSTYSGVLAGSVIGIIVVIACVILVMCVIRKRWMVFLCPNSKDKKKEEKKMNVVCDGMRKAEIKNNGEADNHTYTELVNQEYEFANPFDNGSSQGYELAKSFSDKKVLNSDLYRNDYELAVIIKDDEYVYTDSKENEYDTFQNKEKRKIRADEGNLYSHMTAQLTTDNDYDTACSAKMSDTGDIYDHTTVKQNRENIDANPYDHI